jgi:hypothetical protein
MAWSHITADSNKIVVVQQKTVRRLLIRFPRDSQRWRQQNALTS